jgi:hypothetical protein
MLRKLSPYFLVTLFAAIYLWPFTRILEEAVDEGTFQYGAQLVARGAVPFRDFTELAGFLLQAVWDRLWNFQNRTVADCGCGNTARLSSLAPHRRFRTLRRRVRFDHENAIDDHEQSGLR